MARQIISFPFSAAAVFNIYIEEYLYMIYVTLSIELDS
ncbi:hypothetical protein PITCH_A1800017 [uncultured Desulfobacterium sp.]|uniref:Uncharacterized protein n=1 Tax=uncultured Desulfobacterium sp. TaxID=201089 RepID=A0A445MVF0_9BACT|nr:hypothetical protein PITCH_A1800017 [uncultured Desulfobacterium sp.]